VLAPWPDLPQEHSARRNAQRLLTTIVAGVACFVNLEPGAGTSSCWRLCLASFVHDMGISWSCISCSTGNILVALADGAAKALLPLGQHCAIIRQLSQAARIPLIAPDGAASRARPRLPLSSHRVQRAASLSARRSAASLSARRSAASLSARRSAASLSARRSAASLSARRSAASLHPSPAMTRRSPSEDMLATLGGAQGGHA